MKTCFKCGRELPRSEFYRHPRMGDGLLGKCKDCTKRDVRENRQRHKAYYDDYDKQRAMRPDRVAMRKRYPERDRARARTRNAVKWGRLKKLSCAVCGSCRTEGHHPDYSKPFEVVWLCRKHHVEAHK